MRLISRVLSQAYYNLRTVGATDQDIVGSTDENYKKYLSHKLHVYARKVATCLFLTFLTLFLSPFVFNFLDLDVNFIHFLDPFIEFLLFSIIYFYGTISFYKKIITWLKLQNMWFLVQIINIIDAVIYLCGVSTIFNFTYDDTITLTIITCIDSILLLRLIRLRILLTLSYDNPKDNA